MKKADVYDQVSGVQPARTGAPASSPCAYRAITHSHKLQSILFLCLVSVLVTRAQSLPRRPVEYVNPLIGTAPFEEVEYLGNNPPPGEELYTGTVVPGALAVDAVVKLSPDTGFDGIFHVRGSSYRYTDSSIMGFSHLHHEYNRYANVLFMPTVGPVKTRPGSRDNPGDGYLTGWYVFSAMGFYPVEPASASYVVGSPTFERVTLHLQEPDGSGKGEFVIEARNASDENIYIQSATLNGRTLNRPYFYHWDLIPGGQLFFEMGPKPNKEWGANPEAAPPSVTKAAL